MSKFVLTKTQNMNAQITILDYDLTATAKQGWAKVGLFGSLENGEYTGGATVDFQFTHHDAIVAGIELGHITQPDSTDDLNHRISYENPAFSATVRDVLGYEKTTQHQDYHEVLREFSGTDFAEQIVRRLALQASEVRQVIQAEALSEVLRNAPTDAVEPDDVARHLQSRFPREFFEVVNLVAIADYIKHAWYAAEAETLNSL